MATVTQRYAPWTPQQVYQWKGTPQSGPGSSAPTIVSFSVLAGDGAPTITAGFVKLNVIDRPLRKGFTVVGGYDPITMDIPIQFEGLASQPSGSFGVSPDIEADIQLLEWMAGRGTYYTNSGGQVGSPAAGLPPLVTVASVDSAGTETNLIPPNVQGVKWVISNIAYDTAPYRGRGGNRLRQAATVTVTEYVTVGSAGAGPTGPGSSTAPVTVYSTKALDTMGKLTEYYTGLFTTSSKQAVVALNKPTLKVTSYNKVLKVGTRVLIPAALGLST